MRKSYRPGSPASKASSEARWRMTSELEVQELGGTAQGQHAHRKQQADEHGIAPARHVSEESRASPHRRDFFRESGIEAAYYVLSIGAKEGDGGSSHDPAPGFGEGCAAAEESADAQFLQRRPHRAETVRNGIRNRDAGGAEHTEDDPVGAGQILCAEVHPCEHHAGKRKAGAEDPAQAGREAHPQSAAGVTPGMIDDEEAAMQGSPDHEGPARAMPEAAEHHGG